MKAYMIMKDGKYVKDFTDGEKLTSNWNLAEKFTSKKAATVAAQAYGKVHGKGFKVVEL